MSESISFWFSESFLLERDDSMTYGCCFLSMLTYDHAQIFDLGCQVLKDNSYTNISTDIYQNLTQPSWIATGSDFVKAGAYLNIPVNCSCGDPGVNSSYGLFLTYPVVAGTGGNLNGIASGFNTSTELLRRFNPNIVWDNSQPTQYAFIPVPGTIVSINAKSHSFHWLFVFDWSKKASCECTIWLLHTFFRSHVAILHVGKGLMLTNIVILKPCGWFFGDCR